MPTNMREYHALSNQRKVEHAAAGGFPPDSASRSRSRSRRRRRDRRRRRGSRSRRRRSPRGTGRGDHRAVLSPSDEEGIER